MFNFFFFCDQELLVLDRLNWIVEAVTPLHLLGYCLEKGVLYNNDTVAGKPLVKRLPKYVQKYVVFFSDLCLQEYSFQQYTPAVMCAAIIYASRKALQVEPYWRPELEALTGITYKQIEQCTGDVYQYYERTFPASQTNLSAKRSSPKSVADM